jgi:hypothetical protein
MPLLERNLLVIYLNDHLAGATAGLDLARRVQRANSRGPLGEFLTELVAELEEDKAELERIMKRLGIGRDRVKIAAAWSAEKAGRLKLNGRVTGYSPLSRLEELEGLSLAVEGKLALWQTLRETYGNNSRLRGTDFEELIRRARSQRRRLELRRKRAAADALG